MCSSRFSRREYIKVASDPIARYYDASNNPDGAALPGVPLRDMTEDEWAALPTWLQESADASTLYRKSKPRQAARADEPTKEG